MAANMDGLSSGMSATRRKKPLKGMHVRVMAYANRNASTTTMRVDTIAMKRLLKKIEIMQVPEDRVSSWKNQ